MDGVTPLAPGDVFGDFRIESIAGRGGMGVVYRAVQLDLGRPVALKLIAADRAADPAFRERFQRESRLAALIDHPNVVPVHGAGEADGQLYLVMRYVPGTDLHRLLKHDGPLPPERAAGIVAQVASALDAAHAAGLVHRDVKPANVLIAGEHAYLGDFGLTRMLSSEEQLTETGQWLGTTDFSSPEQLQGERVDARADIYSLGCVLHAALLGDPPFPRSTVPATLLAHLHDPPPRPSERGAPQGFDRVMARALAKDPADRYPSAGDLGRAALAAARGEPVTESERSVAIGPAAPSTNGHAAAPPTALTVAEPTALTRAQTRVREDETTVLPPKRRRRRALAGVFVGIAAAGTAVALIGNPGAGDGADRARAPLSEDEVRDVAQDFAQAYQDEDGTALRRLLTPGVARVLPSGVARGRARVVREYESQFRSQQTEGYSLDGLAIQGGRAGRASGTYKVDRKDKQPIEGRIVLGMVRDRGQPRIGLIAVTPNS
jgi:serine/threonine-protein kinase